MSRIGITRCTGNVTQTERLGRVPLPQLRPMDQCRSIEDEEPSALPPALLRREADLLSLEDHHPPAPSRRFSPPSEEMD